jgi:hypothetical protein
MRTIFHITGGLGKHVAATSVINSYKHENKDDDIIVCSAYPGVFERNEGVSESRDLNSLEYFYRDYISGRTDTKIFAQDPYRQQDHIFKRLHLIKTWCNLVGTKQYKSSSLNFNFREVEIAGKRFLGNQKPLCVFQPFGGSVHTLPYNWARDIHPNIAQSIVNMLVQKGYHVLHVCNQYHPVLENCERLDERCTVGTLAAIIHLSTERILIDSSLQHIAAAIGKPSKVIWNVTSPTLFGYDMHANILPKADYSKGHRKSYLYDFEIGGIPAECPFDKYTQMFDEEAIYYAVLSDPLDSSNIYNKA